MSYTREHGSVASTPKSLDLLKGSCSAAETQQKISKLAELTARTFFDFISESRRSDNSGGGDSPPKLNFSQVLEHADKFNKVFVDTLTLKWNEIQVGKSPDYSQHCDSADEDEVFENSLYQPCPEDPGQYEPVYENSMESEYDTARDGDYSEDNSQSFGDVTPTPPTESHYSAMQDCDSNSGGKSSHDRLYDSPPAGNSSAAATLEEQLISHFAAQGFKLSSDKGDSSSTASSERNSLHSSKSDQKEHELSGGGNEVTSSSIEAEKRSSKPPSPSANSSASDISGGKNEIYEKSSGLGSNQTNDSQQPGKQRPKLKNAIMDLGSEASEFLRSKKSTDSPKPSLKSGNDMAQNQPKSAPVVIKKESVLEVRIHKTAADAAPSSWQPCRLVMLQTHGGLMLNVHTPPESDKIYCSIFCPLIYEIGEATEAQFGKTADRVLVIKAQENISVTLRARNYEDKHDWICVLRENTDAKSTKRVIYSDNEAISPMTPTQEMFDSRQRSNGGIYTYESGSPGHSRKASTSSLSSSYSQSSLDRNQYVSAQTGGFGGPNEGYDRQKSMPNPPTYIYQDGAVYARQNSHPSGKSASQMNVSEKDLASAAAGPGAGGHVPRISSCGDFMNPQVGASNRGNSVYGCRIPPLEQLKSYPWFHGKLPRETASKMVLAQSNPASGHGIYLVRQSETNENEFTLTFNYEGKAKHLRINVDAQSGICQLQNLQFKSLRHLIDTYTKEKLPIDVKGSDITLKSYIANFGGASSANGAQLQPHKRNKSVDFNMERNTEMGPNGAVIRGGGHYGMGGFNQRGGPPGLNKVSNSQGVYYASHN